MTTPFTFYVIQAAHTDIGYTHPQEQILLMYLEHYDRVLELCGQSADQPESHRFKWTCESSWQVKHYLEHRPERLEEFLACVRRNQIEVTASYLHFTDLIDADAMKQSYTWVIEFCKTHNLPLKAAVHCDINGWPWSLADTLSELGIKYFLSQIHLDSATDPLNDRGSVHYHWLLDPGLKAMLKDNPPFRIPKGFWWQGPQGGQVMHWLGEHYQLGNALGISSYKMFGADKTRYFLEADQLSSSDLLERTRVELPRYLKALQGRGYTLPIGLLATGGFYIDNSPPDLRWCEVIERWNAEQNEIVLKTATVSEWFEALEYEGSAYPTHQVAWPDHWAHGLGSSTRRVAQARRNQRRRVGASLLVKQSGSQLAHQHLNTALESERFALEHTFDAWSTTLRIAASQNEYQQSSKELTFHRSEMFLEEAIGTALRALTTTKKDAAQKPEPHLYSLSTSAVGPRTLHFDAGDLTLNDEGNALVTPEGSTIAVQSDRPELAQFVAVCNPPSQQLWALKPKIDSSKISQLENSLRLETAGWALEIDPTTGTCMQLLDRVTGHDWVDHRSTKGFGALLHETVVHPLGRAATHNLARFVALDVGSETSCNEMGNQQVYRHNTCSQIGQARHLKGPVFDALEWSGEHPSIGQVKMAWRAYHGLPLIELVLDWNKTWNDLPEAAYVPFAFNAQGGTLELETGGGYFRPGQHSAGGQLAGTCSSYYTMQRAAHLRSPDGHSLLWLPLDAPLVMPQEVNYSRWETGEYQWNGFLASMPVNHYWYTNFPTSQRGPIRLRYRFLNPTGYANREQALEAATPLEALGWR